MKLTERQMEIRSVFRNYIVDNWTSPKRFMMFGVVMEVQERLGFQTQDEARAEMSEIPSIGWIGMQMTLNVWMAKYFKPVSNALWDGKSKAQVLALWSKTKRTSDVTPKISVTDNKEHRKINKNHKKLQAIAELHKNKPDRWGKTAWGVVK